MLTDEAIEHAEKHVNRDVFQTDHMFNAKNSTHYFNVGKSAMRCIQAALATVPSVGQPKHILDFACGSGRVTRWLVAGFPQAEVVCSDVRQDSLEFLSSTLGVKTHTSEAKLESVAFDRKFDLIWCGSLITHLPQDQIAVFFAQVAKWLAPRGVAIITTHGREVARRMALPTQKYIRGTDAPKVLQSFITEEFGYVDYVNRKGIGFSVGTPQFFIKLAEKGGLRNVLVQEKGWDNHQDSLVFVKGR